MSAIDPLGPTPHELAGGLPRRRAIALILLSTVAAVASGLLIRSEYIHAVHPERELGCDVNPLIGCSSSLDSAQAHLFGVSNALIGLVAMAALAGIGVALAWGARLPRWMWWGMGAGTVAALAWVAWFVNVTLTVFRSLCPFCLSVWVMTLPLACIVWGYIARTAAPGDPISGARRLFLQGRWLLVLLGYATIAAVIVIGLADKVALL